MMKKLLLGCVAVGAMAFSSNAQKDIAVTWDSPVAGTTIEAGVQFDVSFTIENVGADDLVGTDSVYFGLFVGGQNIFGNSIYLADRANAVVSQGGTWTYDVNALEFSNIAQGGAADFCVKVYLYEGTAQTPTAEPNTGDNESCASMNFVQGTNGLEDGISILGFVNTYPNPAQDVVNFEDNGANAESVALTDLSGKVVLETAFVNGTATANVSALNAGMYLYTVKTVNGELATERLVVE